MLTEKEIIGIFANRLGISDLDDVAIIDKDIIFKSDMLVASTDIPQGMKPWQVARKSVVSCISDLASKGVKPRAAMVSLGLPSKNCTRAFIEGLARGFAIASKQFGVRIVGGDTNESNEIVIDCSVIGFATGKVPPRSAAKQGDAVVTSGMFGLPPAGLAILMRNAAAAEKFRKQAVRSVLEPMPRQHFGFALAKYFSSSIDSSDGLALSLYELADQRDINIVIDNIPMAVGVEDFAKENNLNVNDLVIHGGEEYEIVATIPKANLRRAELIAKRVGLGLHIIGSVQKGKGRIIFNGKMLESRGYSHFSKR